MRTDISSSPSLALFAIRIEHLPRKRAEHRDRHDRPLAAVRRTRRARRRRGGHAVPLSVDVDDVRFRGRGTQPLEGAGAAKAEILVGRRALGRRTK